MDAETGIRIRRVSYASSEISGIGLIESVERSIVGDVNEMVRSEMMREVFSGFVALSSTWKMSDNGQLHSVTKSINGRLTSSIDLRPTLVPQQSHRFLPFPIPLSQRLLLYLSKSLLAPTARCFILVGNYFRILDIENGRRKL